MKLLPLFLLLMMVFGCTAKKLVVKNADSLIVFEIQKRLPLEAEQKQQLDQEVVQFLNQAKTKASAILPVLDNINLNDQADVSERYQKLATHYSDITQDFTAMISRHMTKLSPRQQQEFLKNIEKENSKYKSKSKDKRLKEIQSRYELFLGDIEPVQLKILEKYHDYFIDRANARYDHRIELAKGFETVYQQKLNPKEMEEKFQKLFINYQQKNMLGNRNEEIIKHFLPTLAPRQKEHFREMSQEIVELVRYYMSVNY